jgi:hypothetical protein
MEDEDMDEDLLLGLNTVYKIRTIADDSTDLYSPIHINDYIWMNVGKPYRMPVDYFRQYNVLYIARRMIGNYEYQDIRISVGREVMRTLRLPSNEYDSMQDSAYIDGINFVYDKNLPPLELRLQRRLSREEYMKHSLCVDPWTPQYQQEPCYDDSATQKRRKKDEIMDRLSILKTFLKDMEDKDMLGKSLEVKKVIYSVPCTIVIWKDGDKTIVRCQEGDSYSKEVGLLMCLAKRVWGKNASGSNFNDYISKVISEKEENE